MILKVLITELGTITQLTISETLSRLLWREGFDIKPIKQSDIRIRNLSDSDDMYEMALSDFRVLATLAEKYQKLDKAIGYYERKFSAGLVNGVVGNFDNLFNGLATDTADNAIATIDVLALPNRVLAALKHYFNEPFIVENVRLSDEKHANIKYVDDTADFRILFTVLDVAMPDDTGQYRLQPLQVDVFGRYDNQIHFDFAQAKTDKGKFLGYDTTLYDKRQLYFQMIFDACQDRQGRPLTQVLEEVAQTFIYDFWLE